MLAKSGYAITLNYAILHCIEIRDDILQCVFLKKLAIFYNIDI